MDADGQALRSRQGRSLLQSSWDCSKKRNVVFESRQAVWSALNDYLDALPVKTASGVRTADLADALVVNKAKITAQQRNEPYRGTYTYDQAALALEGTKAP